MSFPPNTHLSVQVSVPPTHTHTPLTVQASVHTHTNTHTRACPGERPPRPNTCTHACSRASSPDPSAWPSPTALPQPGPQPPSLWTRSSVHSGPYLVGPWHSQAAPHRRDRPFCPTRCEPPFETEEGSLENKAPGERQGPGCFREEQAGWQEAGEPRNVTGKRESTTPGNCRSPRAPRAPGPSQAVFGNGGTPAFRGSFRP